MPNESYQSDIIELEIPGKNNKNNRSFPESRWKEVGGSPEPQNVQGGRPTPQEFDSPIGVSPDIYYIFTGDRFTRL